MGAPRTINDSVDRALSILRRAGGFWIRAALVFAVCFGASFQYALSRPRVYKSETIILYRDVMHGAELGGEAPSDPARRLGLRLKEMVFSRTGLQQLIEQFHLYKAIVDDRGYVDAVEEMRNHIAFRVRDGDTFGLSFEANDPKIAQAVTAKLAEAVVEENSKHRQQQANVIKDFIDAEAHRNTKELKDKETALARFVAEHPEFATESDAAIHAAMTTRRSSAPSGPDATLTALETDLARIESRIGQAGGHVEAARPSRAIPDAESELAAAQRDLTDKMGRYTEQHPDVRAAKARVAAAEAKLRALLPASEKRAAVDGKERDALKEELARVTAQISARRMAMARASVAAEDPAPRMAKLPPGGAARVVALQTEWTRLSHDVGEARKRQAQLEDKQFKASITASSVSDEHNTQVMVLDPAFLPTHPAPPGRAFLAGLSLGLSVVISLATALGSALLDDHLYDRADLERLELLPLIGVVPRLAKGRRGRRG